MLCGRVETITLFCETGALVSAGFEVSATVGRTKELDESFIAEAHTDLSQHGFNTIRTAER